MTGVRVKTAIVGIGAWGRNVARELSRASDLVAYVCNGSPESLAFAKEHLPTSERRTLAEVCADPSITMVAVASPSTTHLSVGTALLGARKHVLLEKPAGCTEAETATLLETARSNNVSLSVGYVFLYDEAYQALKARISREAIAQVTLTWHKHGTFNEPIERNLLTHHLAFALDLLGTPESGTLVCGKATESVCDELTTTLQFPQGVSLTSHIDRTATTKHHSLTVQHSDGTILLWEPGALYEQQGDKKQLLFTSSSTPLEREVAAFLTSGKAEPQRADGTFAKNVLALLASLTIA